MKLRVLVPNFHIHVSVSELKVEGRIVEIFKSLTKQKFEIWERGRTFSFLGYLFRIFGSVFAVWED